MIMQAIVLRRAAGLPANVGKSENPAARMFISYFVLPPSTFSFSLAPA